MDRLTFNDITGATRAIPPKWRPAAKDAALACAVGDRLLTSSARAVIGACLERLYWVAGHTCPTSYAELKAITGFSFATLKRAVGLLVSQGHLMKSHSRVSRNCCTPNIFAVPGLLEGRRGDKA